MIDVICVNLCTAEPSILQLMHVHHVFYIYCVYIYKVYHDGTQAFRVDIKIALALCEIATSVLTVAGYWDQEQKRTAFNDCLHGASGGALKSAKESNKRATCFSTRTASCGSTFQKHDR